MPQTSRAFPLEIVISTLNGLEVRDRFMYVPRLTGGF